MRYNLLFFVMVGLLFALGAPVGRAQDEPPKVLDASEEVQRTFLPPRYLVWVASFLYWAKMKGRRRSAALHSGPDSALGSHPCVALSSGRQLDGKAFVGPPPLWPIRDKSQGARGTASPH